MEDFATICHYTLATGEVAQSVRVQVQNAHLAIIEPLLSPGRHAIPNVDALGVETIIAGTTLIARICGPQGPLFRVWVVLDPRDLPLAVPPSRHLEIAVPACLVEVLSEEPLDGMASWFREFERTLAWAWVGQQAGPAQ